MQNFLPLPKDRKIKNLKILDPSPDTHPEDKQSILDLRAVLDTGETVNIEMQASLKKDFLKRMLFYWARLYGSLLKVAKPYEDICPVYSLIFANFDIFPEQKGYYHSFSIRSDTKPHFRLSQDLGMVVVELSKFLVKNPETLVDRRDLWCYLLKESGVMDMKSVRILSKKGADMKMATDHLIRLSKDESMRMVEEAIEKQEWIRHSRDTHHFDKGVQKGRMEGRMEGIEKGRMEGIEKGRQELIIKLLENGFDPSVIAEVAGVSTDYIKNLKS